jgi:Tfp pilus assembly protein PilZ
VSSNSDRRKTKRYHFESVILHDTLLPDIFYDAKMYDISKGGVHFESDQSLYPGEEIYIGLKSTPYAEDSEKYYSYVRIKWRKVLPNSSFKFGYGAEFIKASESLLKIIDITDFDDETPKNQAPKKESDPREHQRTPYRKVVYFTSRNSKHKGFIKNISRGGAFIITRETFAIGQMINLVFPGTRLKKGLKLKGWIVRVDQNGIGVRFDRRSGTDRRGDLDRRIKITDRRRRKKRIKKKAAQPKASGTPVKFSALASRKTPNK